jgi:hypothetical protein
LIDAYILSILGFSVESKLENKLVVSLSCRLAIARETKVSIKEIIVKNSGYFTVNSKHC